MNIPGACYQMDAALAGHFTHLSPAQRRGLAWWVYGTMLAESACQTKVVTALSSCGKVQTIRQHLREWLYDGADKKVRCHAEIEVTHCFAPLLGWILSLWQGTDLALAVDGTYQGDRFLVLVVSVLYRGRAIPVAWQVRGATQKGRWMPEICALLDLLAPAIPATMRVVVLADCGLCSQRLYRAICAHGWHPILRLQASSTFRPAGWRRRHPARSFVTRPSTAWVGQGRAFSRDYLLGTLLVVWGEEAEEPWVLLTDLAPQAVSVWWYALRFWIELGFKALKSAGWHWERTRRTDQTRAARHWLVMAVATTWVLAHGTRVEDAERVAMPPPRLRTPPPAPVPLPGQATIERALGVFQRGLVSAREHLLSGWLWRRLWLAPEPWPLPPATLSVAYHAPLLPEPPPPGQEAAA